MPIIGSDLARTNIPYNVLIQLIVISFVLSSKKTYITEELNLVIHPKDCQKINMIKVSEFLDSITAI